MNKQTLQYIGWALAALVGFIFLSSAYGKITGAEDVIKMGSGLGLDAGTMKMVGIVELIAIVLFLIPQTGILGTLLLSAYMGGAIASHLEHGLPIMAPCAIQAVVFCVAAFRFPELRSRLFGAFGA
jgi:DoxX-like family